MTSFRAPVRLTWTDIKLNITSVILLFLLRFDTLIAHTFRLTEIIILKSYDEKCRFYEKSPRYFGSSLVCQNWYKSSKFILQLIIANNYNSVPYVVMTLGKMVSQQTKE